MAKSYLWLAMALFSSQLASAALSRPVQVHGHRGARARFPENTLPAFDYALQAGVDVLEMDLAVTKDKVLVISHDPTLNPVFCSDSSGRPVREGILIHSLTLSEVKTYDCGSRKNPSFPNQVAVPGTRLPTLDEVFDLVLKSKYPSARKVRFNIETKSDPEHPEQTVGPEEFTRLLIDKLRARKMLGRTIIQSFDYRTLVEARRLEPKAVISALSENPKENLLETAKRLHANIVSPDWEMINPGVVEALHREKIEVVPWTPNLPAAWEKLLEMKVDGIISDDPGALIEYLKTRK